MTFKHRIKIPQNIRRNIIIHYNQEFDSVRSVEDDNRVRLKRWGNWQRSQGFKLDSMVEKEVETKDGKILPIYQSYLSAETPELLTSLILKYS